MKITRVRVFDVVGEDRSGIAIYEIARGGQPPNGVSPHRVRFTEVQTDEGVSGLAIGGSEQVAAMGARLIGADPAAYERIWETMTTRPGSVDGASRPLSMLDVALWDLNAKAQGKTVCGMLGGPVQDRIRAYAAMLGFLPEPGPAGERSAEMVAKGFTGVKWYLPDNELAGLEGLKRNVALVGAVRQAVGPDVDVMVDCILSDSSRNSLQYAIKLARALEEFNVTWLEEPLRTEDLTVYEKLSEATRTPLAFGEHLRFRDQFVTALTRNIASVIQPETHTVGGITEMRKIAALAASFGIPFVPHANESCRNAIHVLFASPSRSCPLAEWGVKINHNTQYFFKDFYMPEEGWFKPPEGVGFGYEIDEGKVRETVDVAG